MEADSGRAAIDIGRTKIELFDGAHRAELEVERDAHGALTEACRARLAEEIRAFFGDHTGSIDCTLPASGASIRTLTLPAVDREALASLVELQVEREFPLPIADIAWGMTLSDRADGGYAATVVAMRRSAVEPYNELLADCSLAPRFTLAALALRSRHADAGTWLQIDIGSSDTELLWSCGGDEVAVRVLRWGGAMLTHAIAARRGLEFDAAEAAKLEWSTADADAERSAEIGEVVNDEIDDFLSRIRDTIATRQGMGDANIDVIWLAGGGSQLAGLDGRIAATWPGVRCQRVGEATMGSVAESSDEASDRGAVVPIIDRHGAASPAESSPDTRKLWPRAALVFGLVLVAMAIPYLPAFLGVASLEAERDVAVARLAEIPSVETELKFLKMVRDRDIYELDTIAAIASVAPDGLRVLELTLDQRRHVGIAGTANEKSDVYQLLRGLGEHGFEQAKFTELLPDGDLQRFRLSAVLSGRPTFDEARLRSIEATSEPSPSPASTPANVTNAAQPTNDAPVPKDASPGPVTPSSSPSSAVAKPRPAAAELHSSDPSVAGASHAGDGASPSASGGEEPETSTLTLPSNVIIDGVDESVRSRLIELLNRSDGETSGIVPIPGPQPNEDGSER